MVWPMICARQHVKIPALGALVAGMLAAMIGSNCATAQPVAPAPRVVSTALTPIAEPVAPRDAWRLAEAYAAAHADCEVVVGSGDSMLPLYRDRTVLVVRHARTAELQRGMTVVFTGDLGRPVAHTLFEKTPRGWRAMGVGNGVPDRTLVGYRNLIGVVVKAYAPTLAGALVAVAEKPATETLLLAND
jgi:hypothetical protein